MHEQSLIRGLIKQIEYLAKTHEGDRVTKVRVRLGALSHIQPYSLKEHFALFAKGTVAEDATLDITVAEGADDPLAYEVMLDEISVIND